MRERRTCRTCKFFIRVYEKKFHDYYYKRGFCLYGQGEGDFSLYISSTIAYDCELYQEDEEAKKIYEVETKLRDEWVDIKWKIHDGRTKVGKEFKKFKEQYKPNESGFFGILRPQMDFLKMLYQRFYEKHKEEFEFLNESCKMTKEGYMALIYSMHRRAMLVCNNLAFSKVFDERLVKELEKVKKEEVWVHG